MKTQYALPGIFPDPLREQLEKASLLFESLFRHIAVPAAVSLADNGEFIDANDAFLKTFGYSRDEVLGKTSAQLGLYMNTEQRDNVVKALMTRGSISGTESPFRRKDGSILNCSFSAQLIESHGKPLILGMMTDITELRQAKEASEQSDKHYRLLAENTSDVVSIFDLDLSLVWVSPSVQKETGYTVEEMKSIPPDKTMTPESIEKVMAVFNLGKQSYEEGKEFVDHFEMEAEVYRKDGSTFWAENRYRLVRDGEGNPTHILMQSRNITERRRAEQALRESERMYRTLVESIPQRIFLKDENSVYLSCNRNYAEDLNTKPEEIAGHTDYDFYPADLAEKYRADDRRVMKSGSARKVEERYIRQGQERIVQTFKTPIRDDNGELVGVLGIFDDITEHSKADEALRQSEERFRNMANLLPQSVFEANEEGDITFANQHAFQAFGYSAEDLARGINMLDLISLEDHARAVENINLRMKGKKIPPNEYMAVRKDGSAFPVVVYASPIAESARATGIRGILIDISERRLAEEALLQSEARCRLIAENTSDSIWALGPDLRITYQSPSTERLFGYTLREWHTIGWSDFVHPDHLDAVINLLKSFRHGREEGSATIAVRVRSKYGRDMWAEISASPLRGPDGEFAGVVGVTRDVTERKESEIKLLEYKTAVEQSADGIALADIEGHIHFVNEAWARMHGYSAQELVGRHLSVFHAREQYESEVVPFNRRLLEIGSNSGEVWHVRKDGGVFPTHMTTTVLKGAAEEPLRLLALMQDITEQNETERQRHEHEVARIRAEELSVSRRRLISAQEFLRKDIAGQLHGTVQNRLILLAHRLAELEARPASERTAEELGSIRGQLEELQNDHVRPIGHRLFPSILRMGIVAGLESLVDQYSAELPIDLRMSRSLRQQEQVNRKLIPDDVKLALYRVAEEAIGNILKHAPAAKNIVVKLTLSSSNGVCLVVSDDGGGFDMGSGKTGIGLAIASDYAAAAGGNCVIKSVPGKGTRIAARMPLQGLDAGRR